MNYEIEQKLFFSLLNTLRKRVNKVLNLNKSKFPNIQPGEFKVTEREFYTNMNHLGKMFKVICNLSNIEITKKECQPKEINKRGIELRILEVP